MNFRAMSAMFTPLAVAIRRRSACISAEIFSGRLSVSALTSLSFTFRCGPCAVWNIPVNGAWRLAVRLKRKTRLPWTADGSGCDVLRRPEYVGAQLVTGDDAVSDA